MQPWRKTKPAPRTLFHQPGGSSQLNLPSYAFRHQHNLVTSHNRYEVPFDFINVASVLNHELEVSFTGRQGYPKRLGYNICLGSKPVVRKFRGTIPPGNPRFHFIRREKHAIRFDFEKVESLFL